jgi:hypothetical protein
VLASQDFNILANDAADAVPRFHPPAVEIVLPLSRGQHLTKRDCDFKSFNGFDTMCRTGGT